MKDITRYIQYAHTIVIIVKTNKHLRNLRLNLQELKLNIGKSQFSTISKIC